ncbi:amino acid adenylation domain-containing protein [Streptomyces sp. ALI-76-A]|uniref:amino acid adenylation domain-containing protein n=1 Tax=Streptomyces sp. ALI-76-A TaxID=3025736 RepID=UPI00256F2CE0|nr:amino acid adenylation domain-containing protein [Streptomyces sp. ALI-76-A]MDL5199803.1 amino acid adenylation domain-containing protein [Streptomyces sp. ALI-76-A]
MQQPLTIGKSAWVPVASCHGHRSIWPSGRTLPVGWRAVGGATDREDALDAAVRYHGSPEGSDSSPPSRSVGGGDGTVDSAFFRQAGETPAHTAVLSSAGGLSYRQLALRAQQIRASLEQMGVGRGAFVGVCLDRGTEVPAVLLAILSAGAAYVPLGSQLPSSRLRFMARDVRMTLVVADTKYVEALSCTGVRTVTTADFPDVPAQWRSGASSPDDLAYVMYTSGSTGHPKGVEVTHRNVLTFLSAMSELLPAGAPRRVLFSTQLSFDIAGLEIYLPLVHGGTCVVAPYTWLFNARSIASLINSSAPSLVQATPSGWRLLLDAGVSLTQEQTVLCGGDALPPALAERLAGLPGDAFNVYGPTEASIWATAWRITGPPVKVGAALGHARVHVLDDNLVPVPEGQEGEAYIAGPAVARGYHGQPRLTADRFLPDPYGEDAGLRMYATGDMVRRVDGALQWLRRRDTQVKVNGHRIELGEIETAAVACEGVREAAAVLCDGASGPELRLYVVGPLDTPEMGRLLRARLRALLPAAMLPKTVNFLDDLPLTSNGKVDRRSLRERSADACTDHSGTPGRR